MADPNLSKWEVLDYPILFPCLPKTRQCHKWTFHTLCQALKEKKLSCRVWRKSSGQVLETECDHVNVTLKEFYEWLFEETQSENPLNNYDQKAYVGYIDYKYMKDIFEDNPDYLQEVQWGDFGLPSFDGQDSTIWIGKEGSNTSGHQDCYGFNLVTQIEGRKMWVLFPPDDVEILYPTRIPYEESSIFSQVHLGCPDTESFPLIKEEDCQSHLTEAVTRCLATSLLTDMTQHSQNSLCNQLLNPTETLSSLLTNVEYLKCAIENVLQPSADDKKQFLMDSGPLKDDEEPHDGRKNKRSNYLTHFGDWLRSYNFLPAQTLPCLGCCEYCDNKSWGCIIPKHKSIGKEIVFENNCDKIEMDKNISQMISKRKRQSEVVNKECTIAVKKLKDSDDHFSPPENISLDTNFIHTIKRSLIFNDMNRSKQKSLNVQDNPRSVDENSSDNNLFQEGIEMRDMQGEISITPSTSKSCDVPNENANELQLNAYSLQTPYGFDQYLQLMKCRACTEIPRSDLSCSEGLELNKGMNTNINDISMNEKLKDCCRVINRTETFFDPSSDKSELSDKSRVSPLSASTSTLLSSVLLPPPISSSSLMSSINNSCQKMADLENCSCSDCALQSFKTTRSHKPTVNDNISTTNLTEKQPLAQCDVDILKKKSKSKSNQDTPSKSMELCDEDDLSQSGKSATGSFNNGKSSQDFSSLTETEVQKIFFDCILHPSVIGHISVLMKAKCDTILQRNRDNVESVVSVESVSNIAHR